MSDTQEKLGAHEVAAWLRRHPTFLKQFPDLALSLVVPRDEGPTASLASYQLEVLRDKNRELARRLQDLFGNAQENERLTVRTHQLSLALMQADTLEQAIDGATIKLESALEHMFGKLRGKRAAAVPSSDGTEADALLEEEFLENQQAALNS